MKRLSIEYIKYKWQHVGFKRNINNLGWIFFARLASMVVSFIATAYIARHLGPTSYGELSYAISFVALFSFIATLGIDQVIYRDLIVTPEKKNELIGTAIGLRLIAAVIAVILCILSAFLLSPKDVSFFLIFILSFSFIFQSFQVLNYEFQSKTESKYPSLLTLYVAIALNVLKILVVIFDKGVIYLAVVLLLEPVLFMVGFFYFRIKLYGTIAKWRFKKDVAIRMLHDSWPLIFTTAFAVIYTRIDQIMIKNILGANSVGLYDAAVRLSEVWYFIPGMITAALFPAILNAKKVSDELYYGRLRKLTGLLAIITVLIALPATLLANFITVSVFGPAFIGAVIILQIYIWSNVANALNTIINTYLLAENYRKMMLYSSFTGMLTNVVLNIYLIPIYGIAGAAIATLISYMVPFLFIIFTPKTRVLFVDPS